MKKDLVFEAFLFTQYFLMSNKKQGRIVDHNYLNNIFFLTLSTLQSLQLFAEGKHHSHYRHKLFKNYDKVDYSSKNYLEIQSQLQTELIVLRASMKTFAEEHRTAWSPPSNFDIDSANNFVSKAYQFFKSRNDDTSMRLAYDFLSLINGNLGNLFIDTVQIKGNYSEYQKVLHMNYLKESLSKVQSMMEDERDRIQSLGLNGVGELKADLNPHYGQQITSKYLVTSKVDYNQYLKDNKGFDIELIEGKMFASKKEAVDKLRSYQSSIRGDYVTVQLEVCHHTVLDTVIVQ